jgi:hypothetical protein
MQAKRKAKARTTEQVLKEQAEQARAELGNTTTVVRAVSNALAADSSNPWLEVSAELDKVLGAPLLEFTKQGEFAVSDTESIPDGTRCIAHADEIELGWVKWVDGKPAERRMGRVGDKFVPVQRSDLGDTDEGRWEVQDDGSRRDPWQFQGSVPITRLDTGETYCFTSGSKGGLACVAKLTRVYGSHLRTAEALRDDGGQWGPGHQFERMREACKHAGRRTRRSRVDSRSPAATRVYRTQPGDAAAGWLERLQIRKSCRQPRGCGHPLQDPGDNY